MLGMKPIPGVQVTLLSDVPRAPYSGMLPGHIAGYYTKDEMHIDLRRLCVFAKARFVLDEVVGLDLEARRVHLRNRPPMAFDVVSLNIGSTPARFEVPGAREFATPCKPVPNLLAVWKRLHEDKQTSPRVLVVGGGAGGVELALSMKQGLGGKCEIRIAHQGPEIMSGHNSAVRRQFARVLQEQGIETLLGRPVVEVKAGQVLLGNGQSLPYDYLFWVTQAIAPAWIAESGLQTYPGGFVAVSPKLQSLSHPFVFAAGDVATIVDDPRPKSGVFAVRMAKPLLNNLRAYILGTPLRPYRPQRHFLSLIGAGAGEAVASRKWLAWRGRAWWRLKEHIDRKFMRKFEELPLMAEDQNKAKDDWELLRQRSQMRCSGCAAKVGSSALSRAMSRLKKAYPELSQAQTEKGILAGLDAPDDAACLVLPPGQTLLQTVDYMPALLSDPFFFGRIATLHSFSDIFAMGGQAHSCLAAVLLPFAAEPLVEESLFQLLSGVLHELRQMKASLVGGHTAEGGALGLALTCNGLVPQGSLLMKSGLREGETLILTKALGTGAIFAAEMRLRAKSTWIDGALDSMLCSNEGAARIIREHGAGACTDVTGFGLAGHMLEMLRPAGLSAELRLQDVPALEGALECFRLGLQSSLHEDNSRAIGDMSNASPFLKDSRLPLLFDPQTSGGLLASLPADRAKDCLAALKSKGYPQASKIGQVVRAAESQVRIIIG